MSRLRKAAKATVVVQVFNWTGLALSLITVPLYLHWLGQERYGLLLTGLAFAGYLMFSDAGLTWASMLLIAQASGKEDRPAIAGIVRNSFSLAVCSALLVAILVSLAFWIANRPQPLFGFPHHPEFPGLLLAVGFSVVCNLGLSPFYNLFIGLQEAHVAGIYQGCGRLVGTLGAIAVAWSGAPLGFVFAANVAGSLMFGLLAAGHAFRRYRWAFQAGPLWEWTQIRQQLRTGAKSFAMQAGNVLWGTAPVLAISSAAGAQFVPLFSIPMTLLNAPLGVMSSFSASLQAGYGEAFGRGETQWVADTVRRILRQLLVVLGLLSCGFLLLAGPFVKLWTVGRIELSATMLANVLMIAIVGAILSVFRFTLSGINRHRLAGASDLVCGALAIGFAILAVKQLGYAWVGVGMAVAALLTSAWMLPRELRRALKTSTLFPPSTFLLRWAAIGGTTAMAGWCAVFGLSGLPVWLLILVTGAAISIAFLLMTWKLLPEETGILKRFGRLLPWQRTAEPSGNS